MVTLYTMIAFGISLIIITCLMTATGQGSVCISTVSVPSVPRRRMNSTALKRLHKARLHKASIHKVRLHKARLHKTRLHKASIHKVSIHKARLHKTRLLKTSIHKARLHKNKN